MHCVGVHETSDLIPGKLFLNESHVLGEVLDVCAVLAGSAVNTDEPWKFWVLSPGIQNNTCLFCLGVSRNVQKGVVVSHNDGLESVVAFPAKETCILSVPKEVKSASRLVKNFVKVGQVLSPLLEEV